MIGAKVPLCKQRACLYGRTGTNSFKGGSLPSEVIGPGGTKYFEEIGPGDQFLWGTIHFVTAHLSTVKGSKCCLTSLLYLGHTADYLLRVQKLVVGVTWNASCSHT